MGMTVNKGLPAVLVENGRETVMARLGDAWAVLTGRKLAADPPRLTVVAQTSQSVDVTRVTVNGRLSCDQVHPGQSVYHPGGHPTSDLERLADPPGYTLTELVDALTADRQAADGRPTQKIGFYSATPEDIPGPDQRNTAGHPTRVVHRMDVPGLGGVPLPYYPDDDE